MLGNPQVKLSVHESGKIHLRRAAKQKLDLAPQIRIGAWPWMHAWEMRFLTTVGALAPIGQRELLKDKTALLFETPENFAFYANLIIGPAGHPLDSPLPFGNALWRKRLRNGRPAVLVGRTVRLDEDESNQKRIDQLRETGLKLTFAKEPKNPYGELYDLHWSETGGNVIVVVAMGPENFRSEQQQAAAELGTQPARRIDFQSDRAVTELFAPDGKHIAVIELAAIETQLDLVKGQPKEVELGQLTMRLELANLIAGSGFIASPRQLDCNPRIGGANFRAWHSEVHARFDGFQLSVTILQSSGSLQNKNLSMPIEQLDDSEEIIVAMPAKGLELRATLAAPSSSVEFIGRLTLRDRD
jgi:hypothetical protein